MSLHYVTKGTLGVKGKIFPVTPRRDVGGSSDTAPLIFNLGTKYKCGQFYASAALPPRKELRYLLNRSLGGPQSQS